MTDATEAIASLLRACVARVDVNEAHGTAFWVAHGTLVTCCHIFGVSSRAPRDVNVAWNGNVYNARLSAYDQVSDIALLDVRPEQIPQDHHSVLLSETVHIGDPLYVFGCSDDYKSGEPATPEVEGLTTDPPLLKLKGAQISPGFSGAPVLNLRTGAVCGMVCKTRDRTTDLGGRAVPADVIFQHFEALRQRQADAHSSDVTWLNLLNEDQLGTLKLSRRAHSFTGRVADIYRLLHYTVEFEPVFSGRSADLYIRRRLGDILIERVIKCEAEATSQKSLDSFTACVGAAKKKLPLIQGAIVSAAQIDDSIRAQAADAGITVTSFRELESHLFDGHAYATALKADCSSSPQYDLAVYIEPSVSEEVHGDSQPAAAMIDRWLSNADRTQLTLLGDVGTGKTFLSRVVAHRLAVKYLESPHQSPLPVRIDLRNADRQFTLEGLVLSHLSKHGLSDVSFDIFKHALSKGRIVLILDGFDEMAARVTPQITARNFHELAAAAIGKSKVLLTCRTHYFRSRSEEEEVVFATSDTFGSESARELYWDLIARRGFSIAYLRPFTVPQVEAYVERVKGDGAKPAIAKIREIYNLMELCQRPMLLDMIVKSIDKIQTNNITAAELYRVFTDAWIHRDVWRDVLAPKEKINFLVGLARSLWADQATTIHHSRLTAYVKDELAAAIHNPRQFVEIDNEVRTASFLTRDDVGNYGFAHKSYREYFYARYLTEQLHGENAECLRGARISPEVCGFVIQMVDIKAVNSLLERILTCAYRCEISENALLCLFALRRGLIDTALRTPLRVDLPRHMHLEHAQLDHLNFDGANMPDAQMEGASLRETVMRGVSLDGADLRNADLENADCAGGQFHGARLDWAIMRFCNLEKASITDATLVGADMTEASVGGLGCGGALLANIRYMGATTPGDTARVEGAASMFPAIITKLLPVSHFAKAAERATADWLPEIERLVRRYRQALSAHGIDIETAVSDVSFQVYQAAMESPNIDIDRLMVLQSVRRAVGALTRGSSSRPLTIGASLSQLDDMFQISDYRQSGDGPVSDGDLFKAIESELPPHLWRIISAVYVSGMTYRDIGKSEHVSESTVARWLDSAQQRIAAIPEVRKVMFG